MDKIVKTRKDHKCAYCGKTILKGSTACYMEGRNPKYEVKGFEEKQIGIEYFKVYYCYGAEGDNMPACAGDDDDASDSNCTIHGVRLSLPTIRDMYDEAYGRYTQPTQEHMKNTFMEGAKWCRDITKELSENGNEA